MTARSVFLLITLPTAPIWARGTLGAILEGGSAGLMMAYGLLGKFLVRYRNKLWFYYSGCRYKHTACIGQHGDKPAIPGGGRVDALVAGSGK